MIDQEPEEKSRTRIKNESRALQKLGERLLSLNRDQLSRIDIPEELRDAVLEAHKIHSHSARQRHIQYIGVLMRNIDPNPLLKALEYIDAGISMKKGRTSDAEALADSLTSGNDDTVENFIANFPDTDRQKLRQLIRNSRKNRKFHRNLLEYIREVAED